MRNVVVRLLPFQRTTEELTNFFPVAVSVNAAPPAVALLGERELSVGEGLFWAVATPATHSRIPKTVTNTSDLWQPGRGPLQVEATFPASAVPATVARR